MLCMCMLSTLGVCSVRVEEAISDFDGGGHSFAGLSDCLVTLGLGLLIGWRRSHGEVVINPPEKGRAVTWSRGDELIVIRRTST